MRYKRINNVLAGDVLHDNLYGVDGRLLIAANEPLSDTAIKRLGDLGYNGFYVDTEASNDINVADIITERLRNNTIKGINNLKSDFSNKNVSSTIENASQIVSEILTLKNISIDYIDIRNVENAMSQHSIFVTEASVVIGISLGLTPNQLTELAIAALLHDIGKLFVDPKVMKKIEEPDSKTTEEYSDIKHPSYGFRLFSKDKDLGVNAIINKAILSHHINENGTGTTGTPKYDALIKGTPLYAKIIHAVDEYDIIKHDNINGGPLEAVEYLTANCGTLFDPLVVNAFRKVVAVYPTGTEITISNKLKDKDGNFEPGAIVVNGVVCGQNPGFPNRPIIKINGSGKADLNAMFFQKFAVVGTELDDSNEKEKGRSR